MKIKIVLPGSWCWVIRDRGAHYFENRQAGEPAVSLCRRSRRFEGMSRGTEDEEVTIKDVCRGCNAVLKAAASKDAVS